MICLLCGEHFKYKYPVGEPIPTDTNGNTYGVCDECRKVYKRAKSTENNP